MSSPFSLTQILIITLLGSCFLFLSSSSNKPQSQITFSTPTQSVEEKPSMFRIAIIGAGAAGTSTSFFLSHLLQSSNQAHHQLSTEIFENSTYIGGRSTLVYPFDSELFEPIESGASIFVKSNLNLNKAIKHFKLKLKTFDENDGGNLGIWDGTEFDFRETGQSWLDTAKMFWRYGRAPYQLNRIKDEMLDRYKVIYASEFTTKGPYRNLSAWAEASQLAGLLPISGSKKLIEEQGINVQAVNELAAVACRVNYGQDISEIHGLGTLVSLAGSDGLSVKGGNRQIFERFAIESGAIVHLAHQVTRISKVQASNDLEEERSKYTISYRDAHSQSITSESEPFDAVIIAAPFHQTGIELDIPEYTSRIPNQPYVHLHVTFVITNATSPSGKFFGLSEEEEMPKTIYSTMMRNLLGKGQRPIFNSLSYLRNMGPKVGVIGDLHIVKLFSEATLSTETLGEIFNLPQNLIWVKRIEWDAYPVLNPIVDVNQLAPMKLDQGLYYINGFERLMSTMETETVAAWNVANLISQDLWNFHANQSWASES
ncbi:Prenylcysteine lyase-domain-containing protein [Melampsora americana]|nr:Prenylcysteine lyase-domain-containing protein [Melampsora americana]